MSLTAARMQFVTNCPEAGIGRDGELQCDGKKFPDLGFGRLENVARGARNSMTPVFGEPGTANAGELMK
jgi:hypothetical protein